MRQPGFVASLRQELSTIDREFQARANRPGGLPLSELLSLTTRMDADPAMYHPDAVDPSDPKLVTNWDQVTPEDERTGEEAIKDGRVAFVILAGGLGTRLGGPKMSVRLPHVGLSMLGWKLLQAGNMPVWVMTAPNLLQDVKAHVSELALPPGQDGTIFEQFESYKLTPDNRIAWFGPGEPSMYPLGHGDVGPALAAAGMLSGKVEHAYICNVDNVLASPHSGILGLHLRMGNPVTCEVVDRHGTDRGGVLAWVDSRLQVAEDFRLPHGFADGSPYHSTNTMIIDTKVLASEIPWRWHRVRKHALNRITVQYERLLQQYTEEFPTTYVRVPREARYRPVKEPEDLEAAGLAIERYRYR